MNQRLKYVFIVLCILLGIIVLDTFQAKFFNNSPFLKIRQPLEDESDRYIDKGLLVTHYHCSNNEQVTTWKNIKYTCSLKESNNNEFDFYLTKPVQHNDIRFNEYLTYQDRKIYLAGNIGEFYIKEQEQELSLKTYITTVWQTIDDSIKHITAKLTKVQTYRDGGTTVYKSKEKDITIITCNNINGNKNIYIGDNSLEYTNDLCE